MSFVANGSRISALNSPPYEPILLGVDEFQDTCRFLNNVRIRHVETIVLKDRQFSALIGEFLCFTV